MTKRVEKTSLTACVRTEVHCQPVENEEYVRTTEALARRQQQQKREIQYLDSKASGLTNASAYGNSQKFSSFIVGIAMHPLCLHSDFFIATWSKSAREETASQSSQDAKERALRHAVRLFP